MSPALLLGLVVLAAFGLVGALLSSLLALLWRLGLARVAASSLDLLSLRLLPAAGGLLVATTVVLPAFLRYEPYREHEGGGPILILLAAFAAVCLLHGLWRGWMALIDTRAILARCELAELRSAEPSPQVHVLRSTQPLVGVIGAWRPRIIVTESVRAACDPDELREVLAHEAAHVAARDNLKLLLCIAAPDLIAWTPLARALAARWRVAAEHAADQRATGNDARRRLALASALIKVARLLGRSTPAFPALGLPLAIDDLSGRVRRLLGAPARPVRAVIFAVMVLCGASIPLIALPRYALLHQLLEQLVRLGR